jgi:hypothetical protein
MADDRLQEELATAKAEIRRLRESLAPRTSATLEPVVRKDLSLISLISKWAGSESGVPIEEFFATIEGSARLGKWDEKDQIRITVLKLTGVARSFYNGCPELHEEDVTWQKFKSVFSQRFKDVHSDQYHLMKLQTARQAKSESILEFADRCKALAQKTMRKSGDPAVQAVHRENMERMLLASFVAGLVGVPGKQTRYSSPTSLEQAISLALTVQEAEKQEKFGESFYTRFNDSVRMLSRSPSRTHREGRQTQHTADERAASHMRGQRYDSTRGANDRLASSDRSSQTKTALRCHNCTGFGHFARDCPTRRRGEARSSDSRQTRNPNGRSRRPRTPDRKPPDATNRVAKDEVRQQGNEREARK